jgi:prolipoprotein diacylglyceryltransferase
MAAYGGLIGGVVGGTIALARMRMPVWRFLDACAPAVGLGYFFARLGCFLAGCDFGKLTTSRFGVMFPRGSYAFREHLAHGWIPEDASTSLPVHATQLYAALSGAGLYLVLRSFEARGDGKRFVALVFGYGVARSIIETFRGDETRGHIGPLSLSQVLAVLTIVLTLAIWRAHRLRSA